MSRAANEKRPEQLRDAIVEYLIKHGLADLSLRPLAKAVGSSPRVLLYYFGSKEQMVIRVLAEIRQRQRVRYRRPPGATFAENCRAAWDDMITPDSEPLFRLFFEVYGIALRPAAALPGLPESDH
jgi:AcrR family transcriptional regulator